jgi:hypothetical protein
MTLSLALLATSTAVVGAVIFVALPRVGSPGPLMLFLRFAAASAVAAVGASALYLAYGGSGSRASLAVADMCMVLAPLLLFVALRLLDGRSGLGWSVGAFVVAIAVAAVTTLTPETVSMPVKVAVLAVVCAGCTWTAARSDAEPWSAMRTIALATAAYSVFSVLRGVIAVLTGWGSPRYDLAFSFVPATIVGMLVVAVIGAAVVQLARARDRARVSRAVRPPGAVVVVGDWGLASAAYGVDRVRGLVSDLREAARSLDPQAGDVPRGVEVAVPHPVATLAESLRTTYGWSADEIALLADGASTGAVRTHLVRGHGWSPGRSRRT